MNIADKSCKAYGIEGAQKYAIIRAAIHLYTRAGLSLHGLVMHIEAKCRRLIMLERLPSHLRKQAC